MHTLLLHHNLLNALFLDDLLDALKKNGWQLIDADDAYTDALYQESPFVLPCGESIVWQLAKKDSKMAKTLRYPAEDGEYENVKLEEWIRKRL